MDNMLSIAITELPITGGVSGDPSAFRSVDAFLSEESHLQKLAHILEADGCVIQYQSLIDCLLVELFPCFRDECFKFYEGTGRPLASLYTAEEIHTIDSGLRFALQVLASDVWPTWKDFKQRFIAKLKQETLHWGCDVVRQDQND